MVDRFLEHARVLYFYHGGDDAVYISSADWMPRSFDRRVELLVPIEDMASKRRVMEILDTYFRDNQNSWSLGADGSYVRVQPEANQPKFRAQRFLCDSAITAVKKAEQAARTTFEPHKSAAIKD